LFAHVEFAYFVILINEFNYKRVGSDVCQRIRELPLPELKILISKRVRSYIYLRNSE